MLLPTKPAPSAFERAVLAVVIPGSMLAPCELGLVCALVMVYRRASSQRLAQPGARGQVTVLGESHRAALRTARHRARCELIDAHVNRLIWRQTRGVALHRGEVITLAGRVQRHTRFGAIPVTVLAYCRLSSRSLPQNFAGDLEA